MADETQAPIGPISKWIKNKTGISVSVATILTYFLTAFGGPQISKVYEGVQSMPMLEQRCDTLYDQLKEARTNISEMQKHIEELRILAAERAIVSPRPQP